MKVWTPLRCPLPLWGRVRVRATGTQENANGPHPNPLPEGEGTKVWTLLKKDNFTPFMVYRIPFVRLRHCAALHSGCCKSPPNR